VPRNSIISQSKQMSREQAIEHYILLRLRTEDIRRLSFLLEGLHEKRIQLPSDSPFSQADLKDTVRTAFFGWFATLTDKDCNVVHAFDTLIILFPDSKARIIKIQQECEGCHGVLHQFRNNVAFHSRGKVAAQIKARQNLRGKDTFRDLESARMDFLGLMESLIAEESRAIPKLPEVLERMQVVGHPAFTNIVPPDGSKK